MLCVQDEFPGCYFKSRTACKLVGAPAPHSPSPAPPSPVHLLLLLLQILLRYRVRMMDLVTDNFSLPTPQSRRVRPTERLCLEDHVSPTGFRLQAGFQATTVTTTRISTAKYSSVKHSSVKLSTVELSRAEQIAPLEVQVVGAAEVTTESIRAERRHPDSAD